MFKKYLRDNPEIKRKIQQEFFFDFSSLGYTEEEMKLNPNLTFEDIITFERKLSIKTFSNRENSIKVIAYLRADESVLQHRNRGVEFPVFEINIDANFSFTFQSNVMTELEIRNFLFDKEYNDLTISLTRDINMVFFLGKVFCLNPDFYKNYVGRNIYFYGDNEDIKLFDFLSIVESLQTANLDRFLEQFKFKFENIFDGLENGIHMKTNFLELCKMFKVLKEIDFEETSLTKMLNIPKNLYPHLKRNFLNLKIYHLLAKSESNNYALEFLDIMETKTFANYENLINYFETFVENDYPIKKTVNYLIHQSLNHAKINEYAYGNNTVFEKTVSKLLEQMRYLRDYINMYKKIERFASKNLISVEENVYFEKYPSILKIKHDKASEEYSLIRDEEQMKKFEEALRNYSHLKTKDEKFSILPPKNLPDLINEGNVLSHCVGSYGDKVISGSSKILFMRDSKKINQPLYTVEIIKGKVNQARGYNNNNLPKEAREWLDEWVEAKKMARAI